MDPTEIFEEALASFVRAQKENADVESVRRERLRRVLQNSAESVPLYRDLYRAHKIDIDTIRTPNDLWRLPAVTKADYVRAGPRNYTDNYDSITETFVQKTSGSTGPPFSLFVKPAEAQMMLADFWSAWVAAGVSRDDRIFFAGARQLAIPAPGFNSIFCPFDLPPNAQIKSFQHFAPTVVIGFPDSIGLLATELQRRKIAVRGVRLICVMGQTFTEFLRRMIRRSFECEILDFFGASECGWIGCECEAHSGHHIPESDIIVQIARMGQPNEPAADGEAGELVVTSLLRLTTPFIRYRLHDVAAIDRTPCPCGRASPRLVNIEGRVQDILIARDGHGVTAMGIEFDLYLNRPAISDYRVVQEDRTHVRVNLVVDLTLPPIDVAEVQQAIRKNLGDVEVALEFVSEIPRDPSGKRRRVYRTFDLPGSTSERDQ